MPLIFGNSHMLVVRSKTGRISVCRIHMFIYHALYTVYHLLYTSAIYHIRILLFMWPFGPLAEANSVK